MRFQHVQPECGKCQVEYKFNEYSEIFIEN